MNYIFGVFCARIFEYLKDAGRYLSNILSSFLYVEEQTNHVSLWLSTLVLIWKSIKCRYLCNHVNPFDNGNSNSPLVYASAILKLILAMGCLFYGGVLGVEVKAGQPLKVKPTFDNIIHLSQVILLFYSCVIVELKKCFNVTESSLFIL